MFLKMSSKFSNKVAVSLIHPSGTQMACYWIAWTRVLHLKQVFEALVVDPYYVGLPKMQQPPDWPVMLLKMPDFWGFTYRFMHAMYGPLCLLRFCNVKTACINKLYYFVLQTDTALHEEITSLGVWDELKGNNTLFVAHMKKCLRKKCHDEEDSVNGNNVAAPDDDDSDKELSFDRKD